jgi:hypothetical protein
MTWVWTRRLAVAGFVAVMVAMLATLVVGPGTDEIHDVRVAIVAPGATSSLVAETYQDDTLDLVPYTSAKQARTDLRTGKLAAVVQVDLTGTEDRLLVDSARDSDLVQITRERAQVIEAQRGRTIVIDDIASPSDRGRAERVNQAALIATLGGFLVGLAVIAGAWSSISGRRIGPRRRVPLTLAVSVAAAIVVGAVTASLPWFDTGAAWWTAAAALSFAALVNAVLMVVCASASPALGTAVGSAIVLTFATPLLRSIDTTMLPQPWRASYSYLPQGACRELVASLPHGMAWQPFLVLVVWLGLGVVGGMVASRRTQVWHRQLPLLHTSAAVLPGALALLTTIGPVASVIPDSPPAKPLSTTTECLRVGQPGSVRDLNRITREVRGGEDFGGGDVGADVLLQDGRRLWLFGDTVRNSGSDAEIVRNSMLILGPDCLAVVMPPEGRPVIPNRKDGVGYWPMSVGRQAYEGYDLVTIAAQRLRTTGPGAWDFEVLGPSIAVFVVPAGQTPQLMQVTDVRPDDTAVDRPMWGAASHVDDGWLYLYGTSKPADGESFGHALSVARVRPVDAARPDQWTYWDGSDWQDDEAAAVRLIPAVGGTSQTLSVWRGRDRWYALSKRDDLLGNDVVVWTAPSPTGPFTSHPPVAHLASDLDRGLLRYMPLAHPDLLPQPGTVVISWSNNRDDVTAVLDNPQAYRPRFKRVRLP